MTVNANKWTEWVLRSEGVVPQTQYLIPPGPHQSLSSVSWFPSRSIAALCNNWNKFDKGSNFLKTGSSHEGVFVHWSMLPCITSMIHLTMIHLFLVFIKSDIKYIDMYHTCRELYIYVIVIYCIYRMCLFANQGPSERVGGIYTFP